MHINVAKWEYTNFYPLTWEYKTVPNLHESTQICSQFMRVHKTTVPEKHKMWIKYEDFGVWVYIYHVYCCKDVYRILPPFKVLYIWQTNFYNKMYKQIWYLIFIVFIKAQLERLQAEIAQTAKRTGIASAAKLATIAPKKEIVSIPVIHNTFLHWFMGSNSCISLCCHVSEFV